MSGADADSAHVCSEEGRHLIKRIQIRISITCEVDLNIGI
jgi:hypothetical protein